MQVCHNSLAGIQHGLCVPRLLQ